MQSVLITLALESTFSIWIHCHVHLRGMRVPADVDRSNGSSLFAFRWSVAFAMEVSA